MVSNKEILRDLKKAEEQFNNLQCELGDDDRETIIALGKWQGLFSLCDRLNIKEVK